MRILPAVLPQYYETYSTPEYLNVIEQPLRSWVQWRTQGGYALKSAYRVLLPEYVCTEDPQLHEQVHRAAVALYRELLRAEGYREYYSLELLYHRLVLDMISQPMPLQPPGPAVPGRFLSPVRMVIPKVLL